MTHLVMKAREGEGGPLAFKEHHFSIEKTIKSLVGSVENPYFDKNTGFYHFEAVKDTQAQRLLKLKKLNDGLKVKVEKHQKRNNVRVVIRCDLVKDMPDDKLLKELKPQKVIKVQSVPPANIIKILTLEGAQAPMQISIGLIKVKTEKYYPMPMVCRNCQAIGHKTENCKSPPKCNNCSEREAHNENCKNEPACRNCGGDHRPLDKACPVYRQEKSIIKIQYDQQVHPKTARNIYRRKNKGVFLIPGVEQKEAEIDSDDDINKDQTAKSDNEENMQVEEEEVDASGHPPVRVEESDDDDVVMVTAGEDAFGHPLPFPKPIKIKKERKEKIETTKGKKTISKKNVSFDDINDRELAQKISNIGGESESVSPTPSCSKAKKRTKVLTREDLDNDDFDNAVLEVVRRVSLDQARSDE